MVLEDSTGDSAIIEIIDGKMVIHHGREYTVMTNDPHSGMQFVVVGEDNVVILKAIAPHPYPSIQKGD